jgi:hypothetical protein
MVVGLLDAPQPRLGYAFTSMRPTRYVAYAESALPKNRTAVIQKNSAFSDLGYALYLGSSERSADLLAASTSNLPLRGRRAAITTPFVPAAGPTERLIRGREHAQRLADELGTIADENSRLYAAQRTVAQTAEPASAATAADRGAGARGAIHAGCRWGGDRRRLV